MDLHQNLSNLHFYLSLLSNIGTLVILFLLRKGGSSKTVFWFKVFICLAILLGVCQFALLFHQSTQSYLLWSRLNEFGSAFLPTSFLFFGFYYLGRTKLIDKMIVPVLFVVPSFILLYMAWLTDLVYSNGLNDTIYKPWGYIVDHPAKLAYLSSIWLVSGFFIPIGLMIRSYRKSDDTDYRKQTFIIVTAVVIPFVAGIIAGGILPILGIHIFPIATYLQIVTGSAIVYALIHYGGELLSPEFILNRIVETMGSPAFAVNMHQKIIFANAAALNYFGFSRQQLNRVSMTSLFSDNTSQKLTASIKGTSKSSNNGQNIQSTIRTQAGIERSVAINATAFTDEFGKPNGVVLVINDIQDLKDQTTKARQLAQQLGREKEGVEKKVRERTQQLQDEQARFVTSVNSLSLGFMITDHNDKIIYSNRKLFSLFGINIKTVIDPDISIMMKLADKADIADSIRDCRLNNRSKTIKELQYESRVLRLMFTPVKKGGDRDRNLGIVLIVEDITEQKIQERSREEFFSIASHELRTPLTAIRGNTSMMAAYFPEIKDNKELTSMVADIQDSSVRLIEIVNDFLDASRLEQGKMEFSIESFHLSKIADKVCSDVDNVVKEKNLTLKITKAVRDLPHISADINRVTQVLYNMVGNAIKFTEKGGIVIDASVVGRMARITISDTGHGIPTEKQSLLFHKFQQASASLYTRDATRGTGLGLYISMLLIEKMGGKLILDKSEVSKGSEFSFTLPIAISK